MRVLLVHDYGTLNGGAEVMIVALRDALRRRGHETILFTSTARPLPLPLVSDEHCYGTVSTLRRVLQAANPHAAARLRAVLRQFRPDVVHVKMFLTQLSPLILPPLRPFPALLHVVNYNLVCPINTKTLPDGTPCRHRAGIACRAAGCLSWPGVARTLVQRRLTTLDVFDRVIANSDWVARRLRAEGIAVDESIPNGVAVRPQRPPLDTTPSVGFAGRLVRKKGVDVLLRAMALLRERVPGVRLVVVGDGPERVALEGLAAELGMREAVDFLGHLAQDAMERALAARGRRGDDARHRGGGERERGAHRAGGAGRDRLSRSARGRAGARRRAGAYRAGPGLRGATGRRREDAGVGGPDLRSSRGSHRRPVSRPRPAPNFMMRSRQSPPARVHNDASSPRPRRRKRRSDPPGGTERPRPVVTASPETVHRRRSCPAHAHGSSSRRDP